MLVLLFQVPPPPQLCFIFLLVFRFWHIALFAGCPILLIVLDLHYVIGHESQWWWSDGPCQIALVVA